MSKLYFKYGAMGSSKTAQALMCRFNYIQKGFNVYLLKPEVDTRGSEGGIPLVKSRIGLKSECIEFSSNEDFFEICKRYDIIRERSVIIIDEAQFMSKKQVEQLKEISFSVPVLCYGLLTNYRTELFEGSKRLVELADSLTEIKSVCKCGKKAIINAKIVNGKITLDGEEICIGGDESYEGMCYACFKRRLDSQNNN